MATWQQQLPSMQIGNSNAPGNQLPQVPQYQQQPTQGQQILGGLQSLAQTYAGIKQQEQQKQFQQAFGAAYASGDREALKRLAAQNPQQLETIQKAMGFVDADHKQAVADTSMQLQTAAALGPEAVAKVAAQNAPTLQRLGITPAGLLEAYQKDPAQVTKMADLIGMQSVGPEKYFDLKDKAATRQVTMRGQDISRENAQLSAETARRGQDITLRGQNISASNSAADRELRKLELQEKRINTQLSQAKTQAEIDNLTLKKQETQRQQQEAQQNKQLSLGYAAEARDIARNLANNPDLSSVTGIVASRTPVLRDSSQDVLNQANRLQSLLTSDNLKLMSGVLTDRDITFLGNIASGLNITDNGIKGSPEAVKKRLGQIAEKLDAKLSTAGYAGGQASAAGGVPAAPAATQYAAPAAQQAPAGGATGGANYSSLWE